METTGGNGPASTASLTTAGRECSDNNDAGSEAGKLEFGARPPS